MGRKNQIERWQDLIYECYKEMYSLAEPPLDLDEYCKNCTIFGTKDGKLIDIGKPLTTEQLHKYGLVRFVDFDAHYLPQEKFDEIVEKYINLMNPKNKRDSFSIKTAIYLGAGPTSIKGGSKRERKITKVDGNEYN